MKDFPTGTRYHTQDLGDSCGPAVAMMILRQQGVSIASFDQGTILQMIKGDASTRIAGVVTSPSALVAILNSFTQSTRFQAIQASSNVELTRNVLHGVIRRVPPAVIIDDNHWGVVEGVRTDADPQQGPYSVDKVWVHNPVPFGKGNPPPHWDSDDCGKAGLGISDDCLAYRDWLVRVSAPTEPLLEYVAILDAPPQGIALPSPPPPPPPPVPAGVVGIQAAKDQALAQLASDDIAARFAGFGAPSVSVEEVLHVRGLKEEIADYYLVPIRVQAGVLAITRIDAAAGWFRSMGFFAEPQERIVPTRSKILDTLGGGWSNQLPQGRWVWRPTMDSFSPYMPFLQIPRNDAPGREFVYFGLDGIPRFELSDPLPGG